MKGPFVVMEGLLPYSEAGDRNSQVIIPEPDGGALIIFTGLLERQAEDFCERLNNAVQFWLQPERRRCFSDERV